MTTKDRLKRFIKHLDIPTSRFEREVGLSNGYINAFKGSLGAQKLEGILNKYPDLNREWLLFGEGEMLKNNISVGSIKQGDVKIEGDGNVLNSQLNNSSIQITKENEDLRQQIEVLRKEVELKDNLLKSQEKLITEKERLITILLNK